MNGKPRQTDHEFHTNIITNDYINHSNGLDVGSTLEFFYYRDEGRRVHVLCPFCQGMFEKLPSHFEAKKGCRAAVLVTGFGKTQVENIKHQMRDASYAFTAYRALRLEDLVALSGRRGLGDSGVALLKDLLHAMGGLVSPKGTPLPPPSKVGY